MGMTKGCACKPRNAVVTVRNANYSAFNGYHKAWSAYSQVLCLCCGWRWRSKAKWANTARDARIGEATRVQFACRAYTSGVCVNAR